MNRKRKCGVIWLTCDPRKPSIKDSYTKFSFQKPVIQTTENFWIGDKVIITLPVPLAFFKLLLKTRIYKTCMRT